MSLTNYNIPLTKNESSNDFTNETSLKIKNILVKLHHQNNRHDFKIVSSNKQHVDALKDMIGQTFGKDNIVVKHRGMNSHIDIVNDMYIERPLKLFSRINHYMNHLSKIKTSLSVGIVRPRKSVFVDCLLPIRYVYTF
jgi:hypothetical protein